MPAPAQAELRADCGRCVGLCCVALAYSRSADFPIDKRAGEPCDNLDGTDACRVHADLRPLGFKGCTVFDCFGAGQHVTQHTFGGRSWRQDQVIAARMFEVFPVVRRLHELLWYLDEALRLADADLTVPLTALRERVRGLADLPAADLAALDVDDEYDEARPLLLGASEHARRGVGDPSARDRAGSDLVGARLGRADLRGVTLRGSLLIGADLSDARLARCDLLGVDLRDADVSGADLGEAIYLTQTQVSGARGDAATRLPASIERPAHWST